jgi:dienelactone hydrolase
MCSRSLAGLLVLAGLAAQPAAAAPPPAGEEQFVYFMSGASFGSERFSVETRGDTLELRGVMLLSQPVERRMSTRTRLVGADERLVDYLLQTSRGDSLGLRVEADSLRLFAVGPTYRRERALAHDGHRVQVLDNAVASHLWLLARQLQRDPTGATTLTAVVPQQLWTGLLQREPAKPATAELEGKSIAVFRHSLTLAGLLTLMDTDAKGRLLSLRVPIQGFEIRRPGYVAEPGASAAASSAARRSFPTEAITIEGGGPALPGLLTLPEATGGPWPTCLFLHGSGPMDKDMTIGPNLIFAQLAAGLAERGIASLRYDKRTFITNLSKQDKGLYEDSDLTVQEEVLDDALAAWRLLAGDARLDARRLFVLGHSLGAAAAPVLAGQLEAAGLPRPAGLLLLAPPGRDLISVMIDQFRYLNAQGAMGDDELERAEHNAQRLRDGKVGADDVILFAKPRYWDSVNYWKPWRDYAAQPAPALILFGERDYQITAPDRAAWQTALATSPRPGAELQLLPGLNHLFLHGEGKPGPAEYGLPGELEVELLDLLGDWIQATAPATD